MRTTDIPFVEGTYDLLLHNNFIRVVRTPSQNAETPSLAIDYSPMTTPKDRVLAGLSAGWKKGVRP